MILCVRVCPCVWGGRLAGRAGEGTGSRAGTAEAGGAPAGNRGELSLHHELGVLQGMCPGAGKGWVLAEAVLPPRWAEWEGFWRVEAANTGPVLGRRVAGAGPHPTPRSPSREAHEEGDGHGQAAARQDPEDPPEREAAALAAEPLMGSGPPPQ